jgi:hypothetical protein
MKVFSPFEAAAAQNRQLCYDPQRFSRPAEPVVFLPTQVNA